MSTKELKYSIIFFLFQGILIYAQNTVSGKVTDPFGEPIVGATIILQGTLKGSSTDFDGMYTLKDKFDENAVLVFSNLGFKTVEIEVKGRSEINLQMEEDVNVLDEIVLIGYGSQSKKDITGAVSTIDNEAFESRPNTQIGSLLQGQSAGVQVIANSGKPSEGFNIRIRGTNSIAAGSDPLYVVDGVPTTDTRSINPSDIDVITVLKDASSTAIYGAQGGNGVVLITTKRGTTSKPKVSFDTYTGFAEVWKTQKVLNGEQYRDLMTEMGLSQPVGGWESYTERTDWQDEIFQKGFSQNYQASVSGKTASTNYFISAGYLSQEGAVKSSEIARTNFKINIDQNINSWLKLGTRIAYTKYRDVDVNDNNNVNAGGVLLGALTTPSIIGVFNEDGMFSSNPFQNWENPLASTDGLEREFRSNRFLGNLSLEANVTKELTYKINYGIDNSSGVFESFLDPFRTGFGVAIGGRGIYNTNKSSYYILENTLNYKNTFKKHNLEALIGSVNQEFQFENSAIETRNFASDIITTANGGSELFNATSSKSERTNSSFISRLNYSFDDKYLVTANFRADGSSVFGPNNRWGYFPSFSVGWRISNESFIKPDSFISDLKIRAGWGIVGNDKIEDYAYLGRVGTTAYPIGGVAQPGTFPSTLENLDLKWEQSEQTNIGIDVSLFESRLSFTADAYIKKTNDLLLNAPLPTSSGFSTAFQNVGELENKGLEFSLNTKNILTDSFSWNSGFNISFNENEVTSLPGGDILDGSIAGGRGEASLVREGEPLGVLYGYIFGGVDPTTGNAYYIDNEGVSTFTPDEDDRTIIGDANPDFHFGLTNTFNYKGFNLFVFLQGSYGNDLLNATRIETEGLLDAKNQSIAVLDRWRQPGDITDIPRASFGNSDNSRVSTRFIEDASYLRFKTITLSYNLPESLLEKIKISNLKIYVTGENMFTITDYSGLDPEVNAFGSSNSVRGIDFGTYPQTRNLILGLNVTF